ncbi:MAG: hypothetical protein ACXWDN_02995 [Limisphaerales bacterium]
MAADKETANQRYIRLLKQLAEASEQHFTNENDSHEDLLGFEELLNDGYITGSRTGDEMNCVTHIHGMRITVVGRQLLADLQRKEEGNTSIGLIRQNRFAVYKTLIVFILGIIAGLLGTALKDYFWP